MATMVADGQYYGALRELRRVAGLTLIKRLALIVDDGRITHVFYPVFPPDRNAGDVLDWLTENKA